MKSPLRAYDCAKRAGGLDFIVVVGAEERKDPGKPWRLELVRPVPP
jgi:hypothetical protein